MSATTPALFTGMLWVGLRSSDSQGNFFIDEAISPPHSRYLLVFAGGSHPAAVGTAPKFIIVSISAEEELI